MRRAGAGDATLIVHDVDAGTALAFRDPNGILEKALKDALTTTDPTVRQQKLEEIEALPLAQSSREVQVVGEKIDATDAELAASAFKARDLTDSGITLDPGIVVTSKDQTSAS